MLTQDCIDHCRYLVFVSKSSPEAIPAQVILVDELLTFLCGWFSRDYAALGAWGGCGEAFARVSALLALGRLWCTEVCLRPVHGGDTREQETSAHQQRADNVEDGEEQEQSQPEQRQGSQIRDEAATEHWRSVESCGVRALECAAEGCCYYFHAM